MSPSQESGAAILTLAAVSKPAQPQELASIHDRIADAYYGKMGDAFMRKTQERIHWVCANVRGHKVLDVGCSQGIAPILLGREGKSVVGVDSDPKAIEDALAHLNNEPAHVQQQVKLLNDNFLACEFGGERFDTVVMSEVLEHLVNPQDFVARAGAMLAKGGRLVVTVPFGINDFVDHKRTYYLSDIYGLLERHFQIEDVRVFGQWIGLVGAKREKALTDASSSSFAKGLVEKAEAGFHQIERELRDQLAETRGKLEEANRKYRTASEQVATARQKTADEGTAREAAAAEAKHLQAQLAQLTAQLTQGRTESEARQEARHSAEKQSIRTEAALETVRAQLEAANQKYRSATEQVAALKQKVADEESLRQAAASQVAQLQPQLEQARDALEAERARAQAQLAELRAEVQVQAEARHAAEKQSTRSEAALETMRAQFEAANQKYRAATEHVAALKQKVADEESLRQGLAAQVSELQPKLDQVYGALDAERSNAHVQITELRGEVQAQLEARHTAERQSARNEAALETLRAQLDAATQEHRAAREHVATLSQRVTEVESRRQAADAQISQLQPKLEQAYGALESERAAAREQLAELGAAIQTQLEARHAAEKELTQNRGALEMMRARLDEADQRYRAANAQVSVLKQKVADGEYLRQLAAAQVSQLQAQFEQTRGILDAERSSAEVRLAELRTELHARSEAYDAAKQELSRAQAQLESARTQLDSANENARTEAQHASDLRQRAFKSEALLGEANEAHRRVTEQYQALRAEADSKAAVLVAQQKEQAAHIEHLRGDLERTKKDLARQQSELGRAQQARLAAEAQVAKTRAMLSFQLGYLLLHGFKSFAALRQLPGQLIALRHEAKRRKQKRQGTFTPSMPRPTAVAAVTSRPALSTRADQAIATVKIDAQDPAKALKALRVACIMDEFTFTSYQPECNLLQLSVARWQAELEEFRPELLFIESAWRGKDEQWGSKVGHTSAEVLGILEWCRAHQVPTAFWNKEDPVHFETFLTTAKQFDHIFTTDIDCIHRYKAALGHERVYLLPFACQPALSNPIEKYERKDVFCFAGAYYVKYPDRTRDLGNFMSALADYRGVEIYDRNFGKNDPNYQFPPEYQRFIVGNLPFDQIDKAYKGYRYAINLNSIKQSQSMFARRVFELLASNTITVSNFSRGVRLLFGDLVITTDDGDEIVRRIEALAGDDVRARKFRLAGLRKVMAAHTYQDRFAYMVSKVQGRPLNGLLPSVIVTAYAKNHEQLNATLASYRRQTYEARRLIVVVPNDFEPQAINEGVELVRASEADSLMLDTLSNNGERVASVVPDDYYGPNYLLDLVLATRYSDAPVVGKITHYVWSTSAGLRLTSPGAQYTIAGSAPVRCSLVRGDAVTGISLRDWTTSLYTRQLDTTQVVGIDEFNYCRNGGAPQLAEQMHQAVDDLPSVDVGLNVQELLTRAERIAPAEAQDDAAPVLTGRQLAEYFRPSANKPYAFEIAGNGWSATSSLPDGKHEYLYASTDARPTDLGFGSEAKFYFDVSPGLNLQLVLLFLDAQKQRISHAVHGPNRNQTVPIPAGTAFIRLGVRIYGSGSARINGLVLGHRPLRPAEVIGRAEHLVLTNHYPSYEDLYRNGFVHSRVVAYGQRDVKVDVFRLRKEEALSYHEFHDVDVITGSQEALHKLLSGGRYKTVAVHFLDEPMWQVLKHHIDQVRVLVWVHGADIQPWHRREFNYTTDAERAAAKAASDERMRFWRNLLRAMPERMKLIFVSKHSAEEAMEDLGFRLPENKYCVIHNPIDTDLFAYARKPAELRNKILSIRPYASRTYANDLAVQAILALKKKPWFDELQFRMIGDGKLFDEVLEPLQGLPNVFIERRFLSQREIAQLHREYGVFLCPSRMDSQGVSRDEAMASGLVPVTNAVAAIPEFVDESCGVLAGAEDAVALARGIERLHQMPEVFMAMSVAAANRVRSQSAISRVIESELALFQMKDVQ